MKKTVVIGTALLLVQIPLIALVLLQERTWGGPQFDEGSGVATAPDNSVYVTGTTLSFGAGDRDAFLLKYRRHRRARVATDVRHRTKRTALPRR